MAVKLPPGVHEEEGWVGYLNKSGLMKPTIPFMELLSQWEILFNQFHGETLSLVQDPIEKFASILEEKYPDVIKELLFLYSKLRLHIRIKYLNDRLELMDKTLHVRNVNHVNKYTSKKRSKRYITLNQLYCFITMAKLSQNFVFAILNTYLYLET